MRAPDYTAERRLPAGKTCADCRHGKRCDGLFGAVRLAFTSCDFWPNLFSPLPVEEPVDAQPRGLSEKIIRRPATADERAHSGARMVEEVIISREIAQAAADVLDFRKSGNGDA